MRPWKVSHPPARRQHQGPPGAGGSFEELGVPVGDIQEVLPRLVAGMAQGELDEGMPPGLQGHPDELHPGLVREQAALSGIAPDTAADDVLPDGLPAPGEGDHVVQVQLGGGEPAAAVLAAVLVAEEDVLAREADLVPGQAIEMKQQDHPRNPHPERGGRQELLVGLGGLFYWTGGIGFFFDRERLTRFLESLGMWSFAGFIFLQVVQVIAAPVELRSADRHGHGQTAEDQHDRIGGAQRLVEKAVAVDENLGMVGAIHRVGAEQPAEEQDLGHQEDPHPQLSGFAVNMLCVCVVNRHIPGFYLLSELFPNRYGFDVITGISSKFS